MNQAAKPISRDCWTGKKKNITWRIARIALRDVNNKII